MKEQVEKNAEPVSNLVGSEFLEFLLVEVFEVVGLLVDPIKFVNYWLSLLKIQCTYMEINTSFNYIVKLLLTC